MIPTPKIKLALLALACVVLGGPSAGAASTLTKPEIVSAPASSTNATDANFVFTSPDPGVSFTCTLDDGPLEPCTTPSSQTYSSLAEGSHSFSVQAEDGVSTSEPASWPWTVDLTSPSLPGDKTVEATSPLGTVVSFSATDNFDPHPDLSCSPSSGSLFDLGPPASVDCTATDAAGNQSSGSFTVTVVDTTRPLLSPHKDVVVKVQDSLSETVVQYILPLATDNGDPAPVVGCTPSSGSIFQVGTTRVTCSAVDSSGNRASRRFDVVVQHGPAPAVPLLTSNVGALTNNTSAGFSFETSDGASLACKLDRPSGPGTFASCTSQQTYTQLGDGSYLFTVQATNSIGNISVASFSWVVDTTPPGQVRQLRSRFGNGWVRLSWRNPTDVDYKRVLIWRRKVGASSWGFLATRKGRTTFLDDTVPNDTRFEYRLRSVDRAQNASPGAKIEGRASRILKPAFGSLHNSPPLIDWTFVRDAAFFNLQLWRDGRKILSVWPTRSAKRLPANWRFNGGRYSLRTDRYRVYVWAAFGSRPHTHYGPLLGWTEFRMK